MSLRKDIRMISRDPFPKDDLFPIWPTMMDAFEGYEKTPGLKVNNFGFRCADFSKDEDRDVILAGGCSVTFGMGLYEDEIWPSLLHKKIKNSVLYNISRPGWSTFQIIDKIFLYLHNFKKPKEIYILLPDEGRTSGYSYIQHEHGTFICSPFSNDGDEEKQQVMLSNAIHTKNYLFMLEEYCRVQDIELFVSTWNEDNLINSNSLFLKKYHPYNKNNIYKFLYKYEQDNPESKIVFYGRDDVHPGIGYHEYWAEMFYSLRKGDK